MRIYNMTIEQLEVEISKQEARTASAQAKLDRIHGQTDYSDEIAKHFHLGKVGFRQDKKKQERTLNKAIDNGVKACELYDIQSEAMSIISNCKEIIAYIKKYSPDPETYTYDSTKEHRNRKTLAEAPAIKWEKVQGRYGAAYRSGDYEVERCDAGFVAVRDLKGNLITHCKTVKEAKASVSVLASNNAA